jgi:uncharacterized protein (DUF2236 family)
MLDEGYFPKGRSVLRRIHGERVVGLVYGQRALMIGAAHPVNFTGTILSTAAARRPWQRLVHTANVFETVFFGNRAEADQALADVAKLHERVKGTMREEAGPWPQGTPYSAWDPELMLWTVAVIADSGEVLYDTFVRRLSEEERKDLWQDYLLFGELFGMPRAGAPQSWGEFREYWQGMLGGDRLHLTPEARAMGQTIAFEIPMPLYLHPVRRLHNLLLLGTVPGRIRDMYGFPWSRSQQAIFNALALGMRRSRPLAPKPVRLRRGLNTGSFAFVDRTDRRLRREGQKTIHMPAYSGKGRPNS